MNVAIVIATCGGQDWAELALARAHPSAARNLDVRVRTREAIIYIRHYPDKLDTFGYTVAQARNAAADEVDADWLCFLDADDELEPGYLDAMSAAMAAIDRHRVHMANASPLLVPAVRRVTGDVRTGVPAAIPNRGKWPTTNECVIGTLVQRGLFQAVGGFRDRSGDGTPVTMYEDWDLWLRCWDAGAPLVYVPGAVYREHVNPAGRNTNPREAQSVYDAIWADHLARNAQPVRRDP